MTVRETWPATTCTCTAVRRIDRVLTRVYDQALRPAGLATTQFSLLSLIARAPEPLTLGTLAEAQAMDRTTLTRALAPLVRDGLVAVAAGDDRRSRVVRLTGEGRARLDAARPLWRAVQDRVTKGVGEDRLQRALDELAEAVKDVRDHDTVTRLDAGWPRQERPRPDSGLTRS